MLNWKRKKPSAQALLERSTEGWDWQEAGRIPFRVAGRRLELAIPRDLLGLTGEKLTLEFKWVDNMQNPGDIMDFYQYGDVAPPGRFNYVY